ncbi:MAG: Dabb family protein [Gemmataceae bacterium]
MTRKLVCGSLAALLGTLWLAGGADAQDKKPALAKNMPPYVHAVIFHMKKDAPADAVENMIRDSHELLGKIPTVRHLWVGRPAELATPEYAKKDYQVGLLVLFDNYEGLKTYLDHPLHTEYLKRHGQYWDNVPVYDFVNQKK